METKKLKINVSITKGTNFNNENKEKTDLLIKYTDIEKKYGEEK